MVSRQADHIDFEKLEEDVASAMIADERYWRENDAKLRAVNQKVATYDEFRDMVLAAHLNPLDKKDRFEENMKQPWNTQASNNSDTPVSVSPLKIQDSPPRNGVEMTRVWRKLNVNTLDKYNLLLRTGADRLYEMFKTEITGGLLGEILCALQRQYRTNDTQAVIDIMAALSKTNRFGLSLQFLSSDEKRECQKLLEKLSVDVTQMEQSDSNMNSKETEDLSDKYSELLKHYSACRS